MKHISTNLNFHWGHEKCNEGSNSDSVNLIYEICKNTCCNWKWFLSEWEAVKCTLGAGFIQCRISTGRREVCLWVSLQSALSAKRTDRKIILKLCKPTFLFAPLKVLSKTHFNWNLPRLSLHCRKVPQDWLLTENPTFQPPWYVFTSPPPL